MCTVLELYKYIDIFQILFQEKYNNTTASQGDLSEEVVAAVLPHSSRSSSRAGQ